MAIFPSRQKCFLTAVQVVLNMKIKRLISKHKEGNMLDEALRKIEYELILRVPVNSGEEMRSD